MSDTHTLDDVIRIAQDKYTLKVTEENKPKYIGFVQRQLDLWGYDLNYRLPDTSPVNTSPSTFPYLTLVVDKLLIFAYLIREKPIIDEFDEETFLDCDEKLSLLRVGASRDECSDRNLYNLYVRRQKNHKNHGLLGYINIINEIGADPEVVLIWGRELGYQTDVSPKTQKPYTLRETKLKLPAS